MDQQLLQWICCPVCHQTLELNNPIFSDTQNICTGQLYCLGCHREYLIMEGVPWLLDLDHSQKENHVLKETSSSYGFLWGQSRHGYEPTGLRHIERVLSLLGEEVVQGRLGIDAGSGMGDDTEFLAKEFPDLTLLSIDISLGVNITQKKVSSYSNVHVIRASVLQLPLRNHVADFVYSYGVLHHSADPRRGFNEFSRVINPKGRVILYLYEDHARHPMKRLSVKTIRVIRKVTVRFPPRVLYGLCYILSPLVVIFFSWPARILSQFKKTRSMSEWMPFNFGKGLFSVVGDLYDRFSTPEEFRFRPDTILQWYQEGGFDQIQVTQFRDIAGWVSIGRFT